MKTSTKFMATAAALLVASGAQATTLTFDNLDDLYGDGASLGANMTGDGQYLAYTEAGYVLTLETINQPGAFYGAHIGDAGSNQTFNWHDDGDNQTGAYVTLTKVDGGAFNLDSFDYAGTNGISAQATAGSYAALVLPTEGSGTYMPGFRNVTSVTFSSDGYHFNQLDNVTLSAAAAVPETATWAMMIGGIGFAGGALRRQRRTTATVRFA